MLRRIIIADFETVSACDLKKSGARVYAEHWSTDVLTLRWRVVELPSGEVSGPYGWRPGATEHEPRLRMRSVDPFALWIAHNDGFEKAIWRAIMVDRYGFSDIPAHQWHDTMAACAMKVVPLKLERALGAVGLENQKDMEGSRLTIGLSTQLRKKGEYDKSPTTLKRVEDYCDHDVDDELALHSRLGFLPRNERLVWLLDQQINERGVMLDEPLIRKMQEVVDKASEPLAKEFGELTGGLRYTQRDKFMDWLMLEGFAPTDLRKETVDKLLEADDDDEDEPIIESNAAQDDADFQEDEAENLSPSVKRALSIRRLAGSAAIKKLPRMLGCIAGDGRAHGLLQYHGAGTGRWSGRLLQPQNFPRGTLEFDGKSIDPRLVVEALMTGDPEFVEAILGKPAIEAVISALRHCIRAAPGKELVVGDFAQIEARVVLAIAQQFDKIALLARGDDPYCDMAGQIFRRLITKADAWERGIGKNSVLGLGFQMGAKTFQKRYAQDHELDFCQNVVNTYRQDWAPEVPNVWRALENAALETARTRKPHSAYGVEYRVDEQWMAARLPSGRDIWYHKPALGLKRMPWSTKDNEDIRQVWTYSAVKVGKYVRVDAYGGLLTENVVQAVARDLLVHAMFLCEKNGFPVVLTVHDEIVTEPDKAVADYKALEQIMGDTPSWAKAMKIPVKAECWQGERYRK